MQLDLFGFPLEEKPAKKQEKKATVEKIPSKQEETPAQVKTAEPVAEEYTEVNIHAIPGLRQISILDAEAIAHPPAPVTATPTAETDQPAAETATTEPAVYEELQAVEDTPVIMGGGEPITEVEPFIAETQPADEIPADVLEAMAEEIALLEESLEEQEVIQGHPPIVAEAPLAIAGEPAAEEHPAEDEGIEETEAPVEETTILAIDVTGDETAVEELLVKENIIEEATTPVEETPVSVTEAKADAIFAEEEPAGEGAYENTQAETPNEEEIPGTELIPVVTGQMPGPAGVEEEPELLLYVTDGANQDENVIDFNQTLFSKQSVEEMVSPVKKAALQAKGKRGRKSFKDIDAEIALVEVPDDEELFQKLYYPISQVAQWFNVNTSLLRFWENEFDILKPRKNRKGDRLFRPEDVKNLQVIYHLLRQRKFSIEGAKKYIKQNKSRAEINIQLIQSLTKFRSFLLEMKANLGA